jgi:hypothetical protein
MGNQLIHFVHRRRTLLGYQAPADWPRADAFINRQTLFEPSELGCLLRPRGRPIRFGQAGRHWFWGPLPKQNGLGCRAETRQHWNFPILSVEICVEHIETYLRYCRIFNCLVMRYTLQ